MKYIVAQPKNYWLSPTAVSITLNALGDANRIQASVANGARILCFIKEVEPGGDNGDGLGYDNGHNYKAWPVTISPTYFNSFSEKYVYVAIPRSTSVGTMATFVFPSDKLDIYGRVRHEVIDPSTGQQVIGDDGEPEYTYEQVGSTDYFYIWTQGIISSSGAGGQTEREWTQEMEFGTLSTDEGLSVVEGDWWSYSILTDMVTFLKDITKATIHDLKAWTLTVLDNATFKKSISVAKDATIGGVLTAYNAVMNTIKSSNFSGYGMADTGWMITNDYNGHSYAVVDELYVRMKAVFEELEVKKRTVTGGDETWSAAANRILRVDYLDGNGGEIGYETLRMPWVLRNAPFAIRKFIPNSLSRMGIFGRVKRVRVIKDDDYADIRAVRCYFLAQDSDGNAVDNMWAANDLARCQTFNLNQQSRDGGVNPTPVPSEDLQPGHYYTRAGNTFWWRKVKSISTTPVDIEGKLYHYFDVMYNANSVEDVKNAAAGSDLPCAGDSVVQFGNTVNSDRMNVVCIEINGSGNADAPCIKAYRGIYTFDLSKCWWGGRSCMKMKLSPATGYQFYGPMFDFIQEYGVAQNPIDRPEIYWEAIAFEYDAYNRQEYPAYSDDILDPTTGAFVSRSDATKTDRRYVRKCYYNDRVSHNGSLWVCSIIAQQYHWENASGIYITDQEYEALPDDQKALCSRHENYTNEEPSEESGDWTEVVSKGSDGAFKSRVFCRSNTTPNAPSNDVTGGYNTFTNPLPPPVQGQPTWSDGVPPQGEAVVWSSTAWFYPNGKHTNWTAPAPESDTADLDIEYSPELTQPANPYGTDASQKDTQAYITQREAQGWYDPSRLPANQEMVWRAECKIKNGEYVKKNGVPAWTVTRILGERGLPGGNTATVMLFKRSGTPVSAVGITIPLYYKFEKDANGNNVFTNEACTTPFTDQTLGGNGWSPVIPSGTEQIYVTMAVAYSADAYDNIDMSEWAAPVQYTENGINTAPVFLYQRYAPTTQNPTPAKPQVTLYYKFADGKLYTSSTLETEATTQLNGWSLSIPDDNGNPCFVIQAAALSTLPYDAIEVDSTAQPPKDDWSDVRKLVEDGKNSVRLDLDNQHEDFLYDSVGNRKSAIVTSQARLYDGPNEVTTGITWAVSCDDGTNWVNQGNTYTTGNAKAKVSASGLLTVEEIYVNTAKIKVRAMYGGKPYYAEFTSNKQSQDKYELILSPNSIPYNPETYSTKTITISAKRMSIDGGEPVALTFGAYDDNSKISNTSGKGYLRVFAPVRSTPAQGVVQYIPTQITSDFSVNKVYASDRNNINFQLRRYDNPEESDTYGEKGIQVDYEDIPIVKAENGADAISIVSANKWYALSTIHPDDPNYSDPPSDSAFTEDEFPTTLNANYYVWEATKITFSDGDSELTGKMCLGPTTDFLSGTEVYAISTSKTNPPADNQFDTTYNKTKGYYLWTATKVTYTDGTDAYLNKKCVGYWGEDGDTPDPTQQYQIVVTSASASVDGNKKLNISLTCNVLLTEGSDVTQVTDGSIDAIVGSRTRTLQNTSGTHELTITNAGWTSYGSPTEIVLNFYLTSGNYLCSFLIPINIQGEQGEGGLQGCVIRTSEWAAGQYYRNDEGEEGLEVGYIDVVAIEDSTDAYGYKFYRCKEGHTSSNSNKPSSNGNRWWEGPLTNIGAIYTSLLVAKNAYIKFGTGNEFRITDDNGIVQAGMKGGATDGSDVDKIRFWAGTPASGQSLNTVPFRVYHDGSVVMNNAEIKGELETMGGNCKIYYTDYNPHTPNIYFAGLGTFTEEGNEVATIGSDIYASSGNYGVLGGVIRLLYYDGNTATSTSGRVEISSKNRSIEIYGNTNSPLFSVSGGDVKCDTIISNSFKGEGGKPAALPNNIIKGSGTKPLPSSPAEGMVVFAKGYNESPGLTITSTSVNIMPANQGASACVSSMNIKDNSYMFVYDGYYWVAYACFYVPN